MQTQYRRILAIDPGTRLMGVAFLDDGKLMYHTVKVIAKGRSPHQTLQRARDAVLRLIDDLAPQVIAVERTFFSMNRNAALLNVLFDEIRSIGRRKRLEFVSYAPSTIKKFTCGNGHAGKKEVATVVVSKFPELKVYLTQNREWKERFHQNMFDAVALAIMAATSLAKGYSANAKVTRHLRRTTTHPATRK
jgi:Holliday junction resolvasome RuvABC endonuclease subunit